ncbi:MAG: hypothetical protein NZ805_09795 [Armatimonadetes bacterium]|nr:hypothetical protein [Armatimonadota bacterium]MDW8028928.1 hypothetical protein [Armatimonadota bacterium]
MKLNIPMPVALGVIILALLIVGVIFWRALFKPREVELKPEQIPAPLKEMMQPSPRQAPTSP